jgi:hypothetical protein
MAEPRKFRKRPVVIEAMRYTDAASCAAIHEWMGDPEHHDDGSCGESPFVIDTLEGGMDASVGDWVIRGVQGEFYPCKPGIFAVTYQEVSDDA